MSDLRCSCGFVEKIEAALERISEKRNTLVLGLDQGNWWLSVPAKGKEDERVITFREPCEIASAIIRAADVVDPPEKKEREWRVGDVVKNESRGTLTLVTGFHKVIADGGFTIKGQPLTTVYSRTGWRNLSVEAEQAGEK